jgi:hypothetical protein
VRDVGQKLVFSVVDPVSGKPIWGEAAYEPPSVRRAAAAEKGRK